MLSMGGCGGGGGFVDGSLVVSTCIVARRIAISPRYRIHRCLFVAGSIELLFSYFSSVASFRGHRDGFADHSFVDCLRVTTKCVVRMRST